MIEILEIALLVLKIFLSLCALALVFVVISHFILEPAQVCGTSMFPTYKDGEIVVCLKLSKEKIQVGDVGVFKHPRKADRFVIKRVAKIEYFDNSTLGGFKSYYVLGDNSNDSEDSRDWGWLPEAYLLGRVIPNKKKKGER